MQSLVSSFTCILLGVGKFAVVYYSARCVFIILELLFILRNIFSSKILPFCSIFHLFINFDDCSDLMIPEEAGKL